MGSVKVQLQAFLTSALDTASRLDRLISGENVSNTHWKGAWVGPTTGRDEMQERQIYALVGNRIPNPLWFRRNLLTIQKEIILLLS
jgi:hypothetical protein